MIHSPQRTELLYTPLYHIPIGEPMLTTEGTRAVKFKKPGTNTYEVVTVDTLIAMMVNAIDKENKQCPQERDTPTTTTYCSKTSRTK